MKTDQLEEAERCVYPDTQHFETRFETINVNGKALCLAPGNEYHRRDQS